MACLIKTCKSSASFKKIKENLSFHKVSSGVKNTKNTMSLPPVVLANFPLNDTGCERTFVERFLHASTADEQLAILKKKLDTDKESINSNVTKLLVVVFFNSPAKHPVKCFLSRYATKTTHIQEHFIQLLTAEITSRISNDNYIMTEPRSCTSFYKDVVSKVVMCVENFPPGARAVENIDKQLARYLVTCLSHCGDTLRDSPEFPQLSSTEKSEVYSLIHLALRLLLHILTNIKSKMVVRPIDDNEEFQQNMKFIKELSCKILNTLKMLLHDKDVPMDTKSVSGILCLMLEYMARIDFSAPESWIEFLRHLDHVPGYLDNDYAELSICSAVITTVPMCQLQDIRYDDSDSPAIVVLVQRLLDIVERSGSDGTLILGVSRALFRVSSTLRALGCGGGAALARLLAGFVWPQLDHYLDSVRHLAAQTLTALVGHCGHLERIDHTCEAYGDGGSGEPLCSMLSALAALGEERRGFYAGVRGAAASAGGARVLRDVAPLPRLLQALRQPHLAATVASTLETLLTAHAQQVSAAVLAREWVAPVLHFVEGEAPEAETLAVLQTLLARAAALEPELAHYIIPYVSRACAEPGRSLKHVLVLVSVAASVSPSVSHSVSAGDARDSLVPYDKLRAAVVDGDREIRLQCLSLVVGGVGRALGGRMALVLRYLTYNINEQDPHCRQRAMAYIKKFVKRVEDAHRSAVRASDTEAVGQYEEWKERVRELCFNSLQCGANHARRSGALTILAAIRETLGDKSCWRPEYAERLLLMLEDSYEANKALALHILEYCPLEYLTGVKELQLDAVISQASELKPTQCASAAYKLELLWKVLPHTLPSTTGVKQPAQWCIGSALLRAAGGVYDALHAPRDRPTYGPLHCLAHLLDRLDYDGIAGDTEWQKLIARIIERCEELTQACSHVVNTAAPEGALPDHSLTDNHLGVVLENGQQVTAQMVLLCAWRTVKEAVTVLGAIGARARVPDTLSAETLATLARVLERTVAGARHRGAVEQAYVAYERLLHRLWRDGGERVRALAVPQQRLARALAVLRRQRAWGHPADRRSAGLPFLVQAVVGSEPGAGGPGTCLAAVMEALFQRASAGEPEDRAHSYNILRALYRHTALDTAIQSYVGEGLRIALQGFAGATWAERNSSTLLLSALMTRVFGVSRARSELSARNRMTGRVFYLRYPHLYDLMQNQLKELSASGDKLLLCPSLYPVLLLLARLYPSSLEGTESNLKLVSFVPLVVCLARSRVERTRRLAAAACVSLVPPTRYVAHLEHLFALISEPRVERNFCHGILLQICALLQAKPDGVDCGSLARCISNCQWLMSLAQYEVVCYSVLQQYHRVLYLLQSRFPGILSIENLASLESHLISVVFSERKGIDIGRALCLADAWRLLLILRAQRAERAETASLILHALKHQDYEVVDATLDYLLILHGRECSEESELTSELRVTSDPRLLASLPRDYLASVASPLSEPRFAKRALPRFCKHLEVVVCAEDTYELIACTLEGVQASDVTRAGDVTTLRRLVRLYEGTPERAAPLLLESIASLATKLLTTDSLGSCAVTVARVMRSGAGPGLEPGTREVAARFLEHSAATLMEHSQRLQTPDTVCVQCEVLSAIVLLLQDEEALVRVRAERAATTLIRTMNQHAGHSAGDMDTAGCGPFVASYTGALLLDAIARGRHAGALLTVLALQHVGAELEILDPLTDECRVFDQNERHNVFLEELYITRSCCARLRRLASPDTTPLTWARRQLDDVITRATTDRRGDVTHASGDELSDVTRASTDRCGDVTRASGDRLSDVTHASGDQLSDVTRASGDQLSDETRASEDQLSDVTHASGDRRGDVTRASGDQLSDVTRGLGDQRGDDTHDSYLTQLCRDNLYQAFNCKLGDDVSPKVELFLREMTK